MHFVCLTLIYISSALWFKSSLSRMISFFFFWFRVDLPYHQNQIGESTIGHYMIFSISPRVEEALLFMKLVFKWLRFIMNKFVIYYQATALKRDILFFFLINIPDPIMAGALSMGLPFYYKLSNSL